MSKEDEKIFLVLLVLVVGTMPFSSIANAWSILGFGLWNLWIAFKCGVFQRGYIIFCGSAILFGMVLIAGLVNTSNVTQALKLGEARYPIFVFPVLLAMTGRLWRKEILRIALLFFAVTTIICGLITQTELLVELLHEGKSLSEFFYWRYSNMNLSQRIGMHPTYLSMYSIFSIAIIYTLWISRAPTLWRVVSGYLGMAYLSIFTLHLASKISVASMGLTFIVIAFDAYRQFGWRLLVALVPLVIGCIILFNLEIFAAKSRFESSYIADTFNTLFLHKHAINPDDDRSIAWAKSMEIIRENLAFGVGTGDVMDELYSRYKSTPSAEFLITNKIDSHNQFLEALSRNGIPGIVALFILYFWGFSQVGLKQPLYHSFIIIIVLSSLTENIIDRQQGAIFFGLMNPLLFILYSNTDRYLTTTEASAQKKNW